MTSTDPTTAEMFHPRQHEHPCPYSNATLDLIAQIIDDEAQRLGRTKLRVLDRFAGDGNKVAAHRTSRDHHWDGLEIEPAFIEADWVQEGNARRSPFQAATFDVDACSVVFPNGMCDTFYSNEPSLRHTYSHALRARLRDRRADLHPDNAGGMAWGRGGRKNADGQRWKAVHVDAIADALRVLRPGGLLLWEASNHPVTPKRGEQPVEVDVIGWLTAELQRQGFIEEAVIPIELQRTKDQAKGLTVTWRGTNAHRALHAHLLCFRRPQ